MQGLIVSQNIAFTVSRLKLRTLQSRLDRNNAHVWRGLLLSSVVWAVLRPQSWIRYIFPRYFYDITPSREEGGKKLS